MWYAISALRRRLPIITSSKPITIKGSPLVRLVKITPYAIGLDMPRVGKQIWANLQRYLVIEVNDKEGLKCPIRLRSICVDCWQEFEFNTHLNVKWLNRRCSKCSGARPYIVMKKARLKG